MHTAQSERGSNVAEFPITDPPQGYANVFHRTTPEAARAVFAGETWVSRENTKAVFVSNRTGQGPDDQADGYGQAVVWIQVPAGWLQIDDEFPSGEEHYQIGIARLLPGHVRAWGSGGVWTETRPLPHH